MTHKEIRNLHSRDSIQKYFGKPDNAQGLGNIEHLIRFYVCMTDSGIRPAKEADWVAFHTNITSHIFINLFLKNIQELPRHTTGNFAKRDCMTKRY